MKESINGDVALTIDGQFEGGLRFPHRQAVTTADDISCDVSEY